MNNIEKRKIDREYATSHALEKCYLSECGIPYTYVKLVDGSTVWKYEKTEALALALAKFWKANNRKYK